MFYRDTCIPSLVITVPKAAEPRVAGFGEPRLVAEATGPGLSAPGERRTAAEPVDRLTLRDDFCTSKLRACGRTQL